MSLINKTLYFSQNSLEQIISQINEGSVLYKNISSDIRHNRSIVIAAVRKDCSNIILIPDIYKDDLEVMTIAVEQDGNLLQYASEDLIQNHNLVLAAVKQNGMALEFVFNYETKFNEGYMYIDGHDRYGPCRYYEPREIIDTSYQNLVDNFEIVSAAVSQNGMAIQFVSDYMLKNKEILYIALKNDYDSVTEFLSSN